MFSLIPKEETFFVLFEEAAANLREGARSFAELAGNSGDLAKRVATMRDFEHRGDEITQRTIDRLNRTFVTPIDREDIYSLVTRIDTILDWMDQASSLFAMYRLKNPPAEILKMGNVLAKTCEKVEEAVRGMRRNKDWPQVVSLAREIRNLEKEGDRLIGEALGNLFDREKDAIQIIKWKEVFEDLENALDAAEDVANVLEGIIIKST